MDATVLIDLQAAERATNDCIQSQRDFHLAINNRAWLRAEAARLATTAFMEAALDAFMRAHRNLEAMSHGD